MKASIRNSSPYRILSLLNGFAAWSNRRFAAPSPLFIKQACLIRNGYPDAIWVETGTYLGQTTKLLSKHSPRVYSIEPDPILFANAREYFGKDANVEILNGTSEKIFPTLLPTLRGDVNFWLDAHYSGGATFRGRQDTPILDELKCIGENLGRFEHICILIDDVRCFAPHIEEFSGYPPTDVLVDWARACKLEWHIEHDIFVAKKRTG
jgi:hypothetical protein